MTDKILDAATNIAEALFMTTDKNLTDCVNAAFSALEVEAEAEAEHAVRRHLQGLRRQAVLPPADLIDLAIRTARDSTCKKSRRGVVVFEVGSGLAHAAGYNGPPTGFGCRGVEGCGLSGCRRLAIHAEIRALFDVARSVSPTSSARLQAVHVKVDRAGDNVPVDGPSCVECAVVLCELGIGMWLFEGDQREAAWRYYEPYELYEASARTHNLVTFRTGP